MAPRFGQVEVKNAVKIHYRVDSQDEKAPWLVFSNSWMTVNSVWDTIADELVKSYQILRYDHRGHGKSSIVREAYTFDDLADDVIALLDELKIERAKAFIGVSMGGITGYSLATRYPKRFEVFVPCSSPSKNLPHEMWEEWKEIAQSQGVQTFEDAAVSLWVYPDFAKASPDVVENLRQMMYSTNKDGWDASVRALMNYDYTEQLRKGGFKMHLVAGSADANLPQVVKELAAIVPGCKTTVIENAGHLPFVEQPRAFLAALEAAL